MPDGRAATSHRFRAVGAAQPKTYLPERTQEGRAEQEGRGESPPPSVGPRWGQQARRAAFVLARSLRPCASAASGDESDKKINNSPSVAIIINRNDQIVT